MKLQEVTAYNLRSQNILNESWDTLTESQRIYIGRWERELWPLLEEYVRVCEADLTPDQIKNIFTSAEQQTSGQKTGLGKAAGAAGAVLKLPIDIAKKVDAKINELGRMAQNAGPIKNADAKFEQLKKDITAKNGDSKIVQGIQKVSDWAKENPGKASLAVGILTAIAAFAGGPAGGAAAGLILRSTNELLKGESLSTAVGKSIKTAAYGAIAGWALEGIGDWLEGLRYEVVPFEKAPGLVNLEVDFTKTFKIPGFSEVKELGSMVVPEDRLADFTSLLDGLKDATAATGSTSDPVALDMFNQLWDFAEEFDTAQFLRDMNLQNDLAQQIAAQNDAFYQNLTMANNAIAAAAQGTATGKIDSKDIKVDGEPLSDEEPKEALSMEDRFDLYVESLNEGPLDAIKQKAKDITQQVTANKLMKAWKAAGEPTDTGSIVNILASAGVSNDQIAAIGQEQKVKLSAPAKAPAADKAAPQAGGEQPAASQAGGEQPTSTPTVQKGDTKKIGGATYKWEGALWVDTATNKPVGIAKAMEIGLGNPKLDPIIAAAKKDPALAKLIKAQVTAKGVKAGTSAAKQAADAGVKGTEVVKTKANTKVSKAPAPKPAAPKPAAPKPELRVVK
jgi:hypothetical protein